MPDSQYNSFYNVEFWYTFYYFEEDTFGKRKWLIKYKEEINIRKLLENRIILLCEIKAIKSSITFNSSKMEERMIGDVGLIDMIEESNIYKYDKF